MYFTFSYSSLCDVELDHMIKSLKDDHPSAGQKMMMGHLRARGVYVQRSRWNFLLNELMLKEEQLVDVEQ